jgi:membrane protein
MRVLRAGYELIRATLAEWSEDKVPRLGAALAYYTVFSLAPLIIIVTVIAGSLFGGQELAQTRLVAQISQLVGREGGEFVNNMVEAARLPRAAGNLTIAIGAVTLLFGALAVFGQLQDAFDTIWEVKPNPSANLWRLMRNRLLSFTMLLVIGFLLLVGLVVSTILTAVGGYLETRIANYTLFAAVVNGLLPVVFTTVLFAIMFKVLPNVQIAWRDVWPGALLTALLFNLAKYGIGFYLGNTRLSTTYGAAGSVLALLVWVYFSAQILFLGAEFMQVYVKRHGKHRPVPSADVVPLSEAERSKQGLPRNEAPAGGVLAGGLARRGRRGATAREHMGTSRLGVLIGFLAGVGTGAVMAALGLRGGSGRGA